MAMRFVRTERKYYYHHYYYYDYYWQHFENVAKNLQTPIFFHVTT